MHLRKKLLAAMTILIASSHTVFAAGQSVNTLSHSPVGYWKTVDEFTGNPRSIVQISRDQNHLLTARVVKVFADAISGKPSLCRACTGDKRNQPIVGMVIVSGLALAEKQWANGSILDPENGRTYKCTARLIDDGKKINIHGYNGLPLFGHSQIWERVDLMAG